MASSGDDDRVAFLYPEKGKNVNWVDQSAHLKDIGAEEVVDQYKREFPHYQELLSVYHLP